MEARLPESTADVNQDYMLNIITVEAFAHALTDSIIQGFASEIMEAEGNHPVSRFRANQMIFADELASAVVALSLSEACQSLNTRDHTAECHSRSSKMDVSKTQPRPDPPLVGSLDYPDAPPCTPLLHERETSRDSFVRKLKGGLAKEFVPSPPPSTPKDLENPGADAQQPELMKQLMHSLATVADNCPAEPDDGAVIDTFAETVSSNIIRCCMHVDDIVQA
ncbi:uncharacterized protein si:dkey-171c9.3 [Synchiropus splendidus]|uniref:uncharacterized protein si:dkey-171c9.3 n=1 Tax=Synchiropus splendidus TaxID=270530 RepID=UPI00237D3633|nr:uncharacterized protein si:dkey-171c9.3 [Synchiropus splendidus]